MSDQQLDYERSPEANKAAFDGFWRISGVSTAIIIGIVLFLFITLVAGNLAGGVIAFFISLIVAFIAAIRL